MDLTTRCPQCGSTFSASLDQLQLRKGYIRCINCAHIFDGFEAVVPNGQEPSQAAAAPHVVRQRPARQEAPAWPVAAQPSKGSPALSPIVKRPEPPQAQPWARPEPVISAARHSQDAPKSEPRFGSTPLAADDVQGSAQVGPSIYIEPRTRADQTGDEPALPDFLHQSPRRGGFARAVWGVLVLMGLLVLLGQLAYVYRTQIASEVPFLRPVLEQACEPLGCTVDYPRRIERISIMDSSLQAAPGTAADNGNERSMVLRIVLRNNYDKPQQWPTLSLDLVDVSGTATVKKILPPRSYLPDQALNGPFEAKSEMIITVPITVTGVKINGYQLGKFFP